MRYPLEDSDSLGRHLVEGEPSVSDRNKPARGMWVLRDALQRWQLYALWAMFFLNTTAGLAILSEAQPMAASIGGASTALAAAFVVTIAVTDAVGGSSSLSSRTSSVDAPSSWLCSPCRLWRSC